MPKLHTLTRVILTLTMVVALGGFLPFSTTNVLANPGYGTITGNIYEEATGNPLYPATIRVENYSTGELVGEFSNYPNGSFQVVDSFNVTEAPPASPKPPINWWLMGGLIAAIIIVAATILVPLGKGNRTL